MPVQNAPKNKIKKQVKGQEFSGEDGAEEKYCENGQMIEKLCTEHRTRVA